ncbi:MAG: 4-alpha-glucanotransferase, partial [Methylophilaceae bacterium]
MNDQQTMLNRLCVLSGIGLDYTDIWGNPHPISEETQLALLGAMGFAVATPDEIRSSLDALENRCWRSALPPVRVVREQETPYAIPVTLPEHRTDELTWLLILENGERHEGRFRPTDLQREEQCQLGDTTFVRYTFLLPRQPGWGYHRLELHGIDEPAAMMLIVTPDTCFRPAAIQGENRVWGTAAQLYSLRSQRNWGVGDYSDLKAVVEFCAEQGAGIVGVSPIHALFPDNPEHASPYGPSSRLFLNVLYLDIEAIPDFAECDNLVRQVRADAFQAQLRALR